MIDHFLRDASWVLSCPFWSTVLQFSAWFLTWVVFQWEIAHIRSAAVLCMLYKIRCNLMHPLNVALPGLYVPVPVRRGALVAHWYTYAPRGCRTSQHRRTFIPLSVSL